MCVYIYIYTHMCVHIYAREKREEICFMCIEVSTFGLDGRDGGYSTILALVLVLDSNKPLLIICMHMFQVCCGRGISRLAQD